LDVLALRSALFTLFVADCLRRLATELVLPYCLLLAQDRARRLRDAAAKKADADQQPPQQQQQQPALQEGDAVDSIQDARADNCVTDKTLLAEVSSDKYEQFDDYLEMCIQHGYILLFASSFPLASLLAIVTNAVETRSDAYKLCFVTRRPVAPRGRRPPSVLAAQTCLAALTNAVIICVSSEQLAAWLPALYDSVIADAAPEAIIAAGMGRYVVAAAFIIEHLILLAGALIYLSISD
uniref:Anoctamin n=1 Tax=Macrostomum lignano TaxID=282301 RepID=A0A1I8GVL0_9PLAT